MHRLARALWRRLAPAMTRRSATLLLCILLTACGESTPPPRAPEPAKPAAPPVTPSAPVANVAPSASVAPPPAPPASPIDPAVVERAAGVKPEVSGDVVKVSFARDDVPVVVDGVKMAPFQGLTSWAAFTPGKKPGVQAMVMGDLVLFEDEVGPVMSAALDHGIEVTALHNHFFFAKPAVFFMHIGGEGSAEELAQGVHGVLDAARAVRAKNKTPASTFGGAPVPTPSKLDAAKLDALFGVKGATKDGMYKATFGRKAKASCGCDVGKGMGVNTWAAFAGTDARAVVDGDFAVTEAELQPVLKALRAGNVEIVAIHHHMTGETPRILFLHYWGKGAADALARTVKSALDLTDWDGRHPTT